MKIVEFKPCAETPGKVTGFVHELIDDHEGYRKSYPAVLICPGGAYEFCSKAEAEPVAFKFFAEGYNAFILYYSVGEEAKGFRPLMELSAAVEHIRENRAEFLTDPERIAVCGFSAGGHLAASLAVLWNDPEFLKVYPAKNNRPDAALLCYPVINAGRFAHEQSIRNVSGSKPGEAKYEFFSLEKHVSGSTCPSFLWHTVEDDAVPVENSLLFMTALQEAGVPFEAHIFPNGAHGMALCDRESCTPQEHNSVWIRLAVSWLNELFRHEP